MRRRRINLESLEQRLALDSTVVFNELMYHPTDADEQLEWVELHNQMAVDMDLSNWRLDGGIQFTFAESTFLSGGDYLVIARNPAALAASGQFAGALGPFTGKLSNNGDTLELIDRNDRLMNEIAYSDGGLWPIAPDGSGTSLAKINRDLASEPAANWASSVRVGGTPGQENFGVPGVPTSPDVAGLRLSEVAPVGNQFWLELVNTNDAGVPLNGYRIMSGSGDSYTLPVQSLAAGNYLTLNVAQLGFQPGLGEELLLAANNGAEMVDAARVTEFGQARLDAMTSEFLRPSALTPGGENVFSLHDDIVINEIMYHDAPTLGSPATAGEFGPATTLLPLTATWRYDDSGADRGEAWREPGYNDTQWKSGGGMFYYETAQLNGLPKTTLLTHGFMTYYFRTTFQLDSAEQSVQLRHVIDDGAVFYINGHRFLDFNQDTPDAELNHLTEATGSVGDAVMSDLFVIPPEFLVSGENVLAVEAHQRTVGSTDVVFGATLLTAELITPPQPAEPFVESAEEWVELFNRGDVPVDLSAWSFDDAMEYVFPAGTVMAPGAYLVVASDPVALAAKYPSAPIIGGFAGSLSNTDERIRLRDSVGNPADEVHYYEGGRWPEFADGGGVTLELRDPWADNASPEAWAASDSTSQTEWRTYTYRGLAQASKVGPDGQWQEFVMGLLDNGEVLLDDIRVVEDPLGTNRQVIQNSTFSAGNTDKWRIIGNHYGDVVADPDEPSNEVLRLRATGETEHMSNHAETTLKFGNEFVNIVNNREYEISFRARWVAGSSQLHTRLYFNRLVQTTEIDQPELRGTPGADNTRLEENVGPTYTEFKHSPVVPAAFAPVTVSARASDAAGVASLTLWYSAAGGAWNSVPMTLGADGLHRGVIPGQAASTIVQFYVEGVDASPEAAVSSFPARGRESRALYKVNDNQAATNGLHNLRLLLTQPDASLLHRTTNLMSNDWIPGTVIYDESQVFYDVGIRLKGSEHSRTTAERLGFSVQFNAEQLFRGVHNTVAIDRSESTGFGQREMLIHAAMNHAEDLPTKYHDLIKVISPQSTHTGGAELQLARYGSDYLDSQYENGDEGNIYEYELVYQLNSTDDGTKEGLKVPFPDSVVGTPIRDMGNNPEDYRWTYLLKNNRAADDYSRLMTFVKGFAASGGRDPVDPNEVIDVDQWLRGYAISMLSGAGDSYGGDGSQHNVMFYERPSDHRFLFMPHDLDAFYDLNRPLVPSSELQKLMNSPARARAYYGHVQDIISTTYNATYMAYWATNYGQLLPAQPFASHLAFIIARSNSILAQVKSRVAETPFTITTADGLVVDEATATIGGNGWVNVREIRLAGSDQPLALTWTDLDSWTAKVPAPFGEHTLQLEAYDFRGNLIATDSVIVESTVSDRPLEDYLRISEIHYHPAEGPPGGIYEDANYEFIELVNTGPIALTLANARFNAGISFDFAASSIAELAPGARLVLVQNADAFASRYGDAAPVAGVYGGRLDNNGERLRLEDKSGAKILDFSYDEDWIPETDGSGYSLVILDAEGPTDAWESGASWRASRDLHGSPGLEEPTLLGDTDGDGEVGITDLNNVRNNFGGVGLGDTDGDGDIDVTDLNNVRNHFGASASSPAARVTQQVPLAPRSRIRDVEADQAYLFAPLASQEKESSRENSWDRALLELLHIEAGLPSKLRDGHQKLVRSFEPSWLAGRNF
ncbi:MAG: lamin tail domain-containing protein [Planctomycetia bacterium]|nr:lamin tail domain-containing protein [Planctomycetia bacterium]